MAIASIQNSIYYPRIFLILAILIAGLVFIIYSIKKLNYGKKEIWKSVWSSFLIALVLSLAISLFIHLFASSFYYEKMRVDCANPPCPLGNGYTSDIFWMLLAFLFPVILFLTLIIYYVVQLIRRRKMAK